MKKDLDQYVDRIKNLSEEERMSIATIVIADIMISRGSLDINSKAEFEMPKSSHTVVVEIDASIKIKD